jgi:phenylacetate-coenzyme A ligase PaaK-like adenylate-forming protein
MLPAVLRNLQQAIKTYRLPARDLRELKRRKLSRSLRWAYEYVPLYHSRFKGVGLTPVDVGDVKDLRRLPTLSKSDLVDNYRAGITAGGLRPDVTWSTTGTSGKPVRIEWSRAMQDVRQALALRRLLVAGVRPWHRIVTIWPPRVPVSVLPYIRHISDWKALFISFIEPEVTSSPVSSRPLGVTPASSSITRAPRCRR